MFIIIINTFMHPTVHNDVGFLDQQVNVNYLSEKFGLIF